MCHAWQRGHMPMSCVPALFTCQNLAYMSFLLANVLINVRRSHTACQCFNMASQHAKRRPNFSTWRANVPKDVPILQTFLLRNAEGNIYTLLYKKFFVILDIIIIRITCIFVSCINIVLYFISVLHVMLKERSMWNFYLFIYFIYLVIYFAF